MRQLLALLALALTGSAFADDRAFTKALEDWEMLYQPLANADPSNSTALLKRIVHESPVREKEIDTAERTGDSGFFRRREEAERRILAILDASFERADPKGRRVMFRFCGGLGDVFGESTVPNYATLCGDEKYDFGDKCRTLFLGRVRKAPDIALDLLDDPDHRVAELAALALTDSHPAVVRRYLLRWSSSPRAPFRGIALMRTRVSPRILTPIESRQVCLTLLDDPSEPIREWAVRMLPPQERWEAYRARRLTFVKSSVSRKRTALELGAELDSPDVVSLAMTALSGDESVAEMAFRTIQRRSQGIPFSTSKRRL